MLLGSMTLSRNNEVTLPKGISGCYIHLARITLSRAVFAGWSSPVARQAHNLKVVSSNLAPATKLSPVNQALASIFRAFLCLVECGIIEDISYFSITYKKIADRIAAGYQHKKCDGWKLRVQEET